MSSAVVRPRYTRTAPVVLAVEGLVKKYGARTVVKGVSFEVRRGEVVGLLGPNGAGKTTSFRMTCGLIPANTGRVQLVGRDVTDWPMYRRAREGKMGYLPQDRSVFGSLSTEKNLYLAMELLGYPRSKQKKRCEELLEKFLLTKVRRTIVGNGGTGGLSGGERRRLEIARALLSEPRILLLDEPFANVDPNTVTEIQNVVRELSAEGIAILITDHQIDATMEIADYCYVIAEGAVLTNGTPVDVLSNEEARSRYFGEKSQQQLDNLLKKIAEGEKTPLKRTGSATPETGYAADDFERFDAGESARPPIRPYRPRPSGYVVEDADDTEDVSFEVGSDFEEVLPPPNRSGRAKNAHSAEKRRLDDDLFDEFVDSDDAPLHSERRSRPERNGKRPNSKKGYPFDDWRK